ncbi:MAG: hypothetical protein SGJ00_06395, partial [bacterium]|nr:hypothetical protein [bacterium]
MGFKILVLGLWDGKSFLPIDFSIHGENGKDVDKPQGMTKKEIKARFQSIRPEECASSERVEEYFKSKSENAVAMCKRAIKNGIIAQYVLTDSWFINAPFIDGIRKIKKGLLHVIGMSKTNRKWIIAVFFKDAKQNLYLGKCQSNYFNAQVADTTICFI